MAQRLSVIFAGVPIADSDNGLRVVQADHAPTYYLPPDTVLASALVLSTRETMNNAIGRATYFDLVINGRRARNAVWSFPAPTARFEQLRGFVAFYPTSVGSAYVWDIRVLPQPGDMTGGWVTPNLTGRIKGAAQVVNF